MSVFTPASRPISLAGESAVAPVKAFNAESFGSTLAAELPDDFKIRNFVPKTYRKATKVMARDIEIAVAAADLTVPFGELALPPELKRATVVHRGALTPDYEHLREHLAR